MDDSKVLLAIVIVLAISVLAWGWHKGWFGASETFVGAYGRTPGMQNCLATRGDGKWSYFNRCMYV